MPITFALKKVLASCLLPPGIFVLILVILGTALLFRRQRRIGWMTIFFGIALWALSSAPVANTLMHGLEAEFSIPAHPSGDVIILLGGGAIRGVPDLTGTAAPSPLMMGRIVATVRLYRRLRLPIIVTGGRWPDDRVSEASVARRFLFELGVPEDAVIEEDRARDTTENARFATAICRRKGFSKPIVLTAAYHLKRARQAFEAAGMTVSLFPAYFIGERNVHWSWRSWLPRARNLYICANALHEYVGLCYYRLVK